MTPLTHFGRGRAVQSSQSAGCWCETYDRATHGPLINFGDQTRAACGLEHPGALCDVPSLLDGGES